MSGDYKDPRLVVVGFTSDFGVPQGSTERINQLVAAFVKLKAIRAKQGKRDEYAYLVVPRQSQLHAAIRRAPGFTTVDELSSAAMGIGYLSHPQAPKNNAFVVAASTVALQNLKNAAPRYTHGSLIVVSDACGDPSMSTLGFKTATTVQVLDQLAKLTK